MHEEVQVGPISTYLYHSTLTVPVSALPSHVHSTHWDAVSGYPLDSHQQHPVHFHALGDAYLSMHTDAWESSDDSTGIPG